MLAPRADQLAGLRDLGIQVVATPAAASVLVAVDAAGVLLADDGVHVQTARHANIETVNMWATNQTPFARNVGFGSRCGLTPSPGAPWARHDATRAR